MWVWQPAPLILALAKQRQEDLWIPDQPEWVLGLGEKFCLKKPNHTNKEAGAKSHWHKQTVWICVWKQQQWVGQWDQPKGRGQKERSTSGCCLACRALGTVQVLQQLHGLAGHYDLFQDGLEEGHHGVLPAGGALVTARTGAGIVTHFLFVFRLFWHAVQCVCCIPEVSVVYRNIFVPMKIQKNFKCYTKINTLKLNKI